jgi:Hemerythrin HHE cation binding domain
MEFPHDAEARLQQLATHSADEHRSLLAMLRAVETLVEAQPHPATGDLARKLAELARTFEAHVDPEEESALYQWMPATFTELDEELRECRDQHGPLVIALEQLARKAESATSVELDSELSVQIRSVVASLRHHEAAESSLLQRALHQLRQAS